MYITSQRTSNLTLPKFPKDGGSQSVFRREPAQHVCLWKTLLARPVCLGFLLMCGSGKEISKVFILFLLLVGSR